MKSRGSTAYCCLRCGTPLRLDERGPVKVVEGRELVVPCPVCEFECRVPLGGVPLEERSAPDVDMAAAVVRGEPPFRDLEAEPPFKALAEPTDPPARKLTLTDRWNALSPQRQKCIVAIALVAVVAGVVFWPTTTEAYPPRAPQPEPPQVNPVNGGPTIVIPTSPAPPPPTFQNFLITAKPIPLNTQITAENAAEFFRAEARPVDTVGGLTSADIIHGKFALRDLPVNLYVTRELFGNASIAPLPRTPPPPTTHSVTIQTVNGTQEYIFAVTATGYKQISPDPLTEKYPLPPVGPFGFPLVGNPSTNRLTIGGAP